MRHIVQQAIKNMEEKLIDIFTDYSEIVIDNLFEGDNELLKEIPLVKTINSVIQFKNSLDEKIFIKKITQFLYTLKDIPQEKKIEMISKVDHSETYKQRVGEKLLEILNRIESDLKPTIIGNLFRAFIKEEIDYQTFLRLSFIVEKTFAQDFIIIKEHNDKGELYSADANLIMSSELFEVGIGTWEKQTGPQAIGKVTEIGMFLVRDL